MSMPLELLTLAWGVLELACIKLMWAWVQAEEQIRG